MKRIVIISFDGHIYEAMNKTGDEMLNILWSGMIIAGILYSVVTGNVSDISNAALDSSKEAVTLCITMLGVMAFWIGSMTDHIGFPGELVPLTVVKMFSSSAATGLLLDLYKEYGTDSRIGLIASISMACTETIFYTMSVYFMTAKVRKSRYTLPGALIATFAGIAASVVLAGMF